MKDEGSRDREICRNHSSFHPSSFSLHPFLSSFILHPLPVARDALGNLRGKALNYAKSEKRRIATTTCRRRRGGALRHAPRLEHLWIQHLGSRIGGGCAPPGQTTGA